MIIVIQCQARKRPNAGYLQTSYGKKVAFVAHPQLAPLDNLCVYARPDDFSDDGRPWRQVLLDYNHDELNPQGLFRAYHLYRENIYERLAEQFGIQKLYILSAGWGLITANFLTPYYDITFSKGRNVQKFKRREKSDRYDDFCMLPAQTDEEILFFGGHDYIPLFCLLTNAIKSKKTVFYNSGHAPNAPGCFLKRFEGAKRNTNWQYDCANAFADGMISVE